MTTADSGFAGQRARRAWLCRLVCALALAGCGHRGAGDDSQVVAAVGGDEITESQVNHALERQSGLRPDQADAAAHRVVSGLVDQQIVVRKALDLKMDCDDRVMQDIEAAKRQLIAAAYLERIAASASKPTPKDVQAYFDGNPAQFAARRVYAFRELAIELPPERSKEVQARLGALRSSQEMTAYLEDNHVESRASQVVLTPENVPAPLLQRIASLAPGQGLIIPNPGGMRVLVLESSRDAPLGLEQARPAITAYLAAQNRRQAVEREMASLRGDTRVAYFGKFADLGKSAAPPSAASAPPAVASASSSTLAAR